MRVGLHADPASQKIPGGLGAYIRCLVGALTQRGGTNEYHLILSSDSQAIGQSPVFRSALPLRLAYPSWNFLRWPGVDGSLDVVHATALAVPPARRAGLVGTIHDLTVELYPEFVPSPWRQIYRRGLRIVLQEAAAICVDTEATSSVLRSRYGVEAERIQIAPLGPTLFPQIRENGRAAGDAPYILHAGTHEPRKNIPALIAAFAIAADSLPDHRLVLAGWAAWGSEAVERAITESRAGDRIVIKGYADPGELRRLYRGASVFAMPSIYEGFGIPLLDALGFGLPCVISRDEALMEVAAGAAITVDPSNGEEFAAALVEAAVNEEARETLRVAGLDRSKEFNWVRTAAATERAYERAGDR